MSEIRVDTISEKTSANGVAIDGLTIKDGAITATTGTIVFNEASADVDFRVESNANTHMLFVDGGNNRVGIGTTPDLGVGLHIRTADSGASVGGNGDELVLENSAECGLSILSGASNNGNIFFGDSGGSATGIINYNHSSNYMAFSTNGGNERMRIDSAGIVRINDVDATNSLIAGNFDLVIGKESSGASGLAIISANNENAYVGFFDTDNSGSFRGTIHYNHTNDYMQIYTSGTVGIRQHSNQVLSASAGVALGVGTANTASNVLDDYEEGTYTPTFTVASGSLTVHGSHNTLAYTKIGRVVHVQGEMRFSSVSSPSGNMSLSLPFAVADLAEGAARSTSGAIGQSSFGGTPDATYYFRITGEGTATAFVATHNSGSDTGVNANQVSTSTEMIVSFTFIAA